MDSLTNTQLGPYTILAPIGRGGAATVYRAHQGSLGRDVAVKVLRRDADPQFAARFAREARAIAALQHANILPVYDFGEQGEVQYLVMRYVEGGRTLRDELAAGPIEPARALRLMVRLLDALGYAHARGVVHRDIKPGNVLLPEPDWPLLADFGIARVGGDTALTLAGQAIGTPDYMSPEQATGRPVDARSDIYSAGVMLYEMLTGRPPFRGDSALAVVMQHLGQAPAPPRLLNPALPPDVEPPVLRALAKDPAERFGSAQEFAAELARVAERIERGRDERPTTNVQGVRVASPPLAEAAPARPAPEISPPVAPPGPPHGQPARAAGSRPPLPLLIGLALLVLVGAGLALLARGNGFGGALDPPRPGALLEDSAWQGGYRYAGGRTYGGRTATWVYGASTEYSTMQASFELPEMGGCPAELRVEGMDSEGPAKTSISIQINGVEVYRGPNPLPDDDYDLTTGTWGAHTFAFDGQLLRAGRNEIRIVNLDEGAIGQPPFFMLDYAEVTCAR